MLFEEYTQTGKKYKDRRHKSKRLESIKSYKFEVVTGMIIAVDHDENA